MEQDYILNVKPISKKLGENCFIVCEKMSQTFFNNKTLEKKVWDLNQNAFGYDFYKKKVKNVNSIFGEIIKNLEAKNLCISLVFKKRNDKNVKHAVLLVGFRKDSKNFLQGYFYIDPDLSEGQNPVFISLDNFIKIWHRTLVFVSSD